MTLPPRPPSPPSGPPIGVRHSRRKEVQPEPPVPPSTLITTLSMNTRTLDWELGAGSGQRVAESRELFLGGRSRALREHLTILKRAAASFSAATRTARALG